jgi:hypothetical protein
VTVSRMIYIPYQLYFTHPEVRSSYECATENLQYALKPPVAMNSVFLGMIPPLARSTINYGGYACILFTSRSYAMFVFHLASPGRSRLFPWARAKSTARWKNMRCTMEASKNIRKGARSGRSVGPEPQKVTLINEDPFPLPRALNAMDTIDPGGYWWPPTYSKFQLAHLDSFQFSMFLCNGDISF